MTGFHLKLIAVVTMLIDHMGVTLFPGIMWLRCVGRIAFPVFCFLIAEGCIHTRSFKKYALRLLVFAVLSELPFNLMHGALLDHVHQNVLWTLLVAALVCWLLDSALNRRTARSFLLAGGALVAGFCLLELGHTDYGGWGMLLVVMLYCTLRIPCGQKAKAAAQLAGTLLFCIGSMGGVSIELFALAALPFLWLYNGQRGFSGKGLQYGFYAFYPVHLLVLALIAR